MRTPSLEGQVAQFIDDEQLRLGERRDQARCVGVERGVACLDAGPSETNGKVDFADAGWPGTFSALAMNLT